ncbi:hypothetical protein ACCO45_000439 [Purpureocillium lilacinum]|uniref:Uncharacterized protein n=1 Tax=Purpureocillium lilacinum TaxID=33203 RepID=A0ACC4E470_PURLI
MGYTEEELRGRSAGGGRIHVLYDPREAEGARTEPTIEIVAVHGLTGHWLRSWTADGSESTYFWLAQALPRSFPTARIVSCEHGGLRENTIESLLWDLLGDREASGCDQVPIVILAHSFGGTLAKQIFIASSPSRNPSEEAQKLHWHIKGFMFFGTTNAGRPSERWSFAFRSSVPWVLVPGHRADPAALIEYLEQVEAVNKDFDSCGGSRVPTVCFYETKPTRIWGWYGVILVPKEMAVAPEAESFPLDADHENLVRFWTYFDPSLEVVMESLGQLVPKMMHWDKSILRGALSPPVLARDGIRILCFDGGGVRGLFSATVLEHLMEEVRKIDTPNNSDAPRPCDYFDLICGTSTGGLLAIMLGRLRMNVRSCAHAYDAISGRIFRTTRWRVPGQRWWDAYWNKPWFSGTTLESETRNLVHEYLSIAERRDLEGQSIDPDHVPLIPTVFPDTCRTFVPQGPRPRHHCTSPMTIGDYTYFDGGIASNNPILEAVREAGALFPDERPVAIVSIGCGSAAPVGPGGGIKGLLSSVLQRVFDADAKHHEFLEQFPGLERNYFRLQGSDELGAIDLAAYEQLGTIRRMARDYVSGSGRAIIQECAQKVAHNNN